MSTSFRTPVRKQRECSAGHAVDTFVRRRTDQQARRAAVAGGVVHELPLGERVVVLRADGDKTRFSEASTTVIADNGESNDGRRGVVDKDGRRRWWQQQQQQNRGCLVGERRRDVAKLFPVGHHHRRRGPGAACCCRCAWPANALPTLLLRSVPRGTDCRCCAANSEAPAAARAPRDSDSCAPCPSQFARNATTLAPAVAAVPTGRAAARRPKPGCDVDLRVEQHSNGKTAEKFKVRDESASQKEKHVQATKELRWEH